MNEAEDADILKQVKSMKNAATKISPEKKKKLKKPIGSDYKDEDLIRLTKLM